MILNSQMLAALIGSRICHDLISPVGAIQNGIELFAMEGRKGPEMTLIEDSVLNASARIRFMRVAFGMAGTGQRFGRAEVVSILDDMARAGRLRYDWSVDGDAPRSAVQEAFLAILCLESGMPRGGTISVTHSTKGWQISGPADPMRPDPDLWEILAGQPVNAPTILPAHVQFAMLPLLLNDRGATADVSAEEGMVHIRL